jgi:hypothetical protein
MNAATMRLPPRQSSEARIFFHQWQQNINNFVQTSISDVKAAKMRVAALGCLMATAIVAICKLIFLTLGLESETEALAKNSPSENQKTQLHRSQSSLQRRE